MANRIPRVGRVYLRRVQDISKSDWIELYADLYRQVFGETASDERWITDAERRNTVLNGYR